MAEPSLKKEHLTPAEFRKAVEGFSDIDWKRLKKISEIYGVSGLVDAPDLEPENLLQEAFFRTIEGKRRCPRNISLHTFMAGVMKSIRSSAFKSLARRNLKIIPLDNNDQHIGVVSSNTPSPDSCLDINGLLRKFNDHFDQHDTAQVVFEGLIEGFNSVELMELTDLSDHSYRKIKKEIQKFVLDYLKEKI